MKKIFTFCVSLLAALSVFAYDFQSGDLFYNITSSSAPYTVEVTQQSQYYNSNYSGVDTIVIPETVTYDSIIYSVTSIGESAFDHSKLTTITIPNTVTSIGEYAFAYCQKLTSVAIGSGVKTIHMAAFNNCSALRTITIPANVKEIYNQAFTGASISTIYMEGTTPPSLLQSKSDGSAFMIFSTTPTCYVPCSAVASYKSSTKWKGAVREFVAEFPYTFTIASANTSLGTIAITQQPDCSTAAIFEAIPNTGCYFTQWSDGNTDNPRTLKVTQDTRLTASFASSTYVVNLIAGANGAVSGAGTYDHGTTATITAIPNDGYHFTQWSDGNTDNPRSIIVVEPISLTALFEENYTQEHCQIIYTSTDGDVVTPWVTYNFGADIVSNTYADGQGVITFDGPVTAIGDTAFANCSSLESIIIPDRVTVIGDQAFQYCTYLKDVTIGNRVESIGTAAFNNCSSLQSIIIPQSVKYIYNYAFVGASLNSIYVNRTIPPTLNPEREDPYMVLGTGMVDVCYIPCGSLASYQASEWKTKGQVREFVERPSYLLTVQSVDKTMGTATITQDIDCETQIATIAATPYDGYRFVQWSDGNTDNPRSWVVTEDTYLEAIFEKSIDPTWQITYTSTDGNIVTPNDENVFGANIVSNTYQDGQGVITFDGPVTSIGEEAFQYCSSLTSITIPNSVMNIGSYAFHECTSLTFISIPNSVTNIGESAFNNCTSLTSITIPDSMISIGDWAFYNSQLETIYVDAIIPPTIGVGAVTTSPICYIPCGALAAYAASKWLTEMDELIEEEGCRKCGDNLYWEYIESTHTLIFTGHGNMYDYNSRRPWDKLCDSIQNVSIPEGVTSIGNYAFYLCHNLSSITIPNSVTSIGNYAFYDCESLNLISLGNTLTHIGKSAFYRCAFSSITLPESLTSIGEGAFYMCDSLVTINIPDGITSIENRTFYSCESLASIKIPDNVVSIGEQAFSFCKSLTSVNIPNNVTNIGDGAFARCSTIDSIFVPKSVTQIGESAFCLMRSLISIVVEDGNTTYDSRENCNAIIETETNTLIFGCKKTKIPNTVINIGSNAFESDAGGMSNIIIPSSVQYIGEYAFNCINMWKITVEAIHPPILADNVFAPYHTNYLECIIPCGTLAAYQSSDWANQVGSFEEECVEGQKIYYTSTDGNIVTPYATDVFGANIVSNTYENGVGTIAFDGPVTTIGYQAFNDCYSLTSITIPNSVTSIGYAAFYNLYNLKNVTIPNSVTSIDAFAFYWCKLDSIVLPEGLRRIGDYAFYWSGMYESIVIPNSVETIGKFAFANLPHTTRITIGCGVTSVGDSAFCASVDTLYLKSLVPPAINISPFDNTSSPFCYIPCGTLAAYQASAWASQVDSLEEECAEGQQIFYTSIDGNIVLPSHPESFGANIVSNTYENGQGILVFDNPVTSIGFSTCSTLTSITIPNSVISLDSYAFQNCSSLIFINIPSSITSITQYALAGCSSLTSIVVDSDNTVYDSRNNCNAIIETSTNTLIAGCQNTIIPNNVTSIGTAAFRGCSAMVDITIPNSITTIGWGAFGYCSSLTSITIPNSVTSILNFAFHDCSSLDTIRIEATTPPALGENVFYGTPSPICVIPCGTIAAYEASDWANYMGEFVEDCVEGQQITYTSTNGNIVTPNDVNVFGANIVSNTYENGQGVITFDGLVTSIGDSAFHECESLASITIPNSVTSIGDGAFAWCSSLTSITIPNSVTSIGSLAFRYCTSLTSMTVENGNTVYDSRENCNAIIETATNTLIAGCQNTIIPNSVTSIGDGAFVNCTSLTSITIPESVTSIGGTAFLGCTSLTSITIPESVTSIGGMAFFDCISLTSVTLGSGVTSIGWSAFHRCTSLTSITCEATTPPTLGEYVFPFQLTTAYIPCGTKEAYEASKWGTYSIITSFIEGDCPEPIDPTWQISYTSTDGKVTPYETNVFGANIVSNDYQDGQGVITFDGPVTSIGDSAFWECAELASIAIPESVTTIGYRAFSHCNNLASVTIPSGVTNIEEAVLAGCPALSRIIVENGNPIYDSRDNCNAIVETATNTLIAGCKNTIIPNTITTIGESAFWYCSTLTSITIPSSVKTIGVRAFVFCPSLTSIKIPKSVTKIEHPILTGCNSATSIVVEEGNPNYDSRDNCNAIIETATNALLIGCQNTIIPNSVSHIREYAFAYSTYPSIVSKATTPPYVDGNAFLLRETPITVYIPCGTKSAYEASNLAQYVSEFVEEGCSPIQKCGDDLYWEYADGVLTITGTGDMYDYAADTDVPWYDVRGNIKTVNLPNAMTKIGQNAFYKCTAMTSINMPTSLTAIGEKAFAQDTKLACEIILPASMTTIASRAFFNCKAVPAFHVEATTPPIVQADAFDYTTAPIHVPCGYGHIYGKHTQWGMLNLEMCELLQDNVYYYPIDGHTARAVTYHSNPTDTIVIPSAVVIDGMPRTVTEVADFAFTDCANLPAISFNEGLEYIGERAFVRCYGLHGTIVLPATLETIGERAFSYCDNVEKYLIQAMTPPALGDGAFTCANHDALFYVSCEVMDDYKVAARWSSLKSRLRDACLNIYHYNTPLGTNGVYTTEDTLVASIYYRRKFTPYRWETLYLPFEVDRVTVLEDGVEYDLTAWDIVYGGHYFLAKPDGMLNKEILFGFTDELESHTPYIIQFSDAYYTDKLITFYGKESWNKLSTSFEVLSSSAWMQIAGNTTLQDQLLEKPVYMLRSGLDFILQKTTTTLHPFECYVMPYATPSGTPARMNVRFRGDVPTAVESVKGNESHLTYTVDGYTLTVYPQGQAFSIYSLNGALIYSCEAGKEAVDCELNSGCYLLHAGTEAHKIML